MNGFSDRGSIPLTSIKKEFAIQRILFLLEVRGIERGLKEKGPVDLLRWDQ